MSVAEPKALVRRAVAAVNAGDGDAVDRLFAPDHVDYDRARAGLPPGPAGVKQAWAAFRAACPDLRAAIEDLIAEGDRAAARITFFGTHRGAFLGLPPTRTAIAVGGVAVLRIAGAGVTEQWREADLLGLLRQLGAVPAPGQGGA